MLKFKFQIVNFHPLFTVPILIIFIYFEDVNFYGGLPKSEVFFIYENPKFAKPPYFLTLSLF
ncbi:MAG: hypothetical protein LBT10_01020 [Methanobrevibacter sp.]|nr:hypothetical protein [Methanobrevibacter sp.]